MKYLKSKDNGFLPNYYPCNSETKSFEKKYEMPTFFDQLKLAIVYSITLVNNELQYPDSRKYIDVDKKKYSIKDLAANGYFEIDWTPGMNTLDFFLREKLLLPINDELILAMRRDSSAHLFSWKSIGSKLKALPDSVYQMIETGKDKDENKNLDYNLENMQDVLCLHANTVQTYEGYSLPSHDLGPTGFDFKKITDELLK